MRTLSTDTYYHILEDLKSGDNTRIEQAFKDINSSDFQGEVTALLLMYKQAMGSCTNTSQWKANAPAALKYMETNGIDPARVLTFKRIMDKMVDLKVSEDKMQLYLEVFGTHMTKAMESLGLQLMDGYRMKLVIEKIPQDGKDTSS